MGITVFVDGKDGGERDYFPVIGSSGLERYWMPIIKRRELIYLEHLVSAGLLVTPENCSEILAEFHVLFEELKKVDPDLSDNYNPASRCKRVLDLIADYCANAGIEIYIG